MAYGIRYSEDETPPPLVVARSRDPAGAARIVKASDAPLVVDANLIDLLAGKAVGDYVTDEETIEALTPHLQRAIAPSRQKAGRVLIASYNRALF